ncbi:heptosyltransferase I [Ereboglobus sp. PH5-5]|uniref:glycosyltransferase family 9 protein n=1 Tax=Ereboglobus sp. PH5-5 TaxID=2940529 RepID=UPI00240533BE|nr:glycosyltransferase family 9 protein [Ereboglobus sp. PH5-5]MDF9832499.1 heptosyltransferase I [Ereboglobus sp. PH5-5]
MTSPATNTRPDAAPGSVCIVRLSALGDVVMVAPLIKMIRREWPSTSITWIIGKAAHPAVASLERLGVEFVVIEKPRGIGDYLALRRQMKGRCFDALFCLQASWRANFIYPCIRARRKIGHGKGSRDMHSLFVRESVPEPSEPSHIADRFLQFAGALGGNLNDADTKGSWGLEPPPDAVVWAQAALPAGRWLAVSPCSSKAERDWPAESYAEVVNATWRAHGLPAVLLGGPSARDRAMADAIREKLSPETRVLDLTGQTTVPQLLAALSRCAALLAPDTGAVHIARAFARPVVGLYAVAPASRTGPYRAAEFCVDKFAEAARLVHGRDPETLSRSARVHDPRAMKLITPQEVLRQIDRALAQV